MVLGFAMCTTMAFAQTAISTRPVEKARDIMAKASVQTDEPVNYKASVFTKDAAYDTVRTFRFSAADWAEITPGFIAQTDHIWVGTTDSTFGAAAHTVNTNTHTWAQWRRYADSATFKANIMNDYPTWVGRFYCQERQPDGTYVDDFTYVLNRIGANNNANDAGYADDGFVFFGYDANNGALGVGRVNAYLELPTVTRPTSGNPVVVGVNQAYYKFYDQCFVDYKIGNNWYFREINVENIDVAINSTAASKARYTMPLALVDQTNIKLRIRVSAQKYAAYGYGWFLDNFAIITNNNTSSWEFNTPTPIDGFYGMIPQGMTIPLSYMISVRNTNITDLTNAKLTVSNAPANGTWSTVATGTPYNLTSGDVLLNRNLLIDERGFIDTNYPGWYGMTGSGNYGNQGSLVGGYLGRALNTQTVGQNFYAIKAEGGSLTQPIDTVLYTVSEYMEFDANEPNRVDGYRWGHDNGLIPAGSVFKCGYTDPDGQGNIYFSSDDTDDHSTRAGYRVWVRYNTGSEIPEGWVFRGLEFVPATDGESIAAANNVLMPITWTVDYAEDGESFNYVDLPCGIDNSLFSVTEEHLSNLPTTGYRLPSATGESNYSAINIMFPDQPELKKNTSYYFGYYLAEDAYFHVAQQQWGFRNDENGTTRYSADEAAAPYYAQNAPATPYDMYVYDPQNQSRPTIYASNVDNFPMIRPIVGEPMEIDRVSVIGNCDATDTLGISIQRGGEEICGNEVEVAVGSNQSFMIYPLGDHSYITSVKVNGQPVEVYVSGGDVPESPYWMYEREDTVMRGNQVVLHRNAYELFFEEIADREGGYVITADVEWMGWTVGIDPVAPDVTLTLAPNPATSSVKLNVNGVSGMVNCSIIDMSGRVVYNANVNAEAETTINVSGMPAGAYFVRVTNDTFSKIEKLIIK